MSDRLARLRARLAEALARRRVPLGFAFGVVVLWMAEPTSRTLMPGTLVACGGEALRIWAAGHLNKSREVTMSGPYRWLAHPLYVGSSVMGLGLAIASGSLIVAVLIAIYLGVMLASAARSEEAFLRRTFGERYEGYRRSGVGEATPGDVHRRFSLSQAIANGEHRAAIGIVVAVLLLLLKATYNDLQ